MGGNISANIAVWTSFCLAFMCAFAFGSEERLLKELGLTVLPDISRINVSIDEYTKMMDIYLKARRTSLEEDDVPDLLTFDMEHKSWWKKKPSAVRLQFPVGAYLRNEVEEAQLKLLLPPQPEGSTVVRVQVNLILGTRQKRVLENRTFYLSRNQSKWCDVDVTSAVRYWLNGHTNLGLELVCLDSSCNINVSRATIASLVHTDSSKRVRRASPYQSERRTDCQKGKRKRKCCRQKMNVHFEELSIPEMNYIVAPKAYEAGYCHGLCPPNYNHATNHSRIQSLMHQMDKNNQSKSHKKRIVPKTCCVPSKLEPLEILLINKDDPTKLMVEKWDNMIVTECACS